jgi:chromate transporter
VLGILIPSTTLALAASRWARERRQTIGVRAFTAGMAPLTIGLLFATGWLLAEPFVRQPAHRIGTLALIALTLVVMPRRASARSGDRGRRRPVQLGLNPAFEPRLSTGAF